MEALTIEILNPKVKQILNNLADLDLISIPNSKNNNSELKELLGKLRINSNIAPSLDEISREVKFVRKNRYAKEKI